LVGVFILAVGIEGYLFSNVKWIERIPLIGAGLLMIVPGAVTDTIGAAIAVIMLFFHWRQSRHFGTAKIV
jgi:TRAP-type uncharacterized transport system fused permease subunit